MGFLAKELSVSSGSPFQKEILVVQSRGMARWVSLQLAERHGILMNARFVFPKLFLQETIHAVNPEFSTEADSRAVLVWRMIAALPALLSRPEFTELRNYLDGNDKLKEFRLAGKLADVFDQYLVYRPEWIKEWESGPMPKDWQGLLWREIARRFPEEKHLAHIVDSLDFTRLSSVAGGAFSKRVSIFGISTLPPLFIRAFQKLSHHLPVHLFLLQPTDIYWGEGITERKRAHLLERESKKRGRPVTVEEMNLSRENPLLESLGGQGRTFLKLIIDADFHPGHEKFDDPPQDTLLHYIQFRMRHNLPDDEIEERKIFPVSDRSIRVHSCHSPMREVEVLYDQLLHALERDQTLLPSDILVMTPKIETYAPLIRAVFGCPENPALRIPFSIADRNPRNENHVVDVFLRLLELPGSRFASSDILSLLGSPVFRTRFAFQEEDISRMREWIRESGIRWGMDATHREALSLPAISESTWRHGLDRLLLGYALKPDGDHLFGGILPCDGLEGEAVQAMGRFVEAIEALIGPVASGPAYGIR